MFEFFEPHCEVEINQGGSLPHWSQKGKTYFITFRTTDSIPVASSRRWDERKIRWLENHGINYFSSDFEARFNSLSNPLKKEFHQFMTRNFQEELDRGYGKCPLRIPEVSQLVKNTLLHFDKKRYLMGDFVIMPNHVHLLVSFFEGVNMVSQCTSWKRFSAKKINDYLKQKGRFWQRESFDHLVRSEAQFEDFKNYIKQNPAKLKPGSYLYYRAEHTTN